MSPLSPQLVVNTPFDLGDSNLSAPLDTIESLTSRTNGPLRPYGEHARNQTNDPVALKILRADEANELFKIYFERCHPLAPFLDVKLQRNAASVQQASIPLFLAILVAAARYWAYQPCNPEFPNRCSNWLHPRYARLVSLLDDELARLALKPVPDDSRLETVEAFVVYGHWFPLEAQSMDQEPEMVSRYRASSCFHVFGQALRWACLLQLGRDAHLPFAIPPASPAYRLPTHDQLRRIRVYAYLIESDHHLASLSHLPISTDPRPLCDPNVVAAVRAHPLGQPTDARVMAILQLAAALHRASLQSGDPCLKKINSEALQAFNATLDGIEGAVLSLMNSQEMSEDHMLAHMPFSMCLQTSNTRI